MQVTITPAARADLEALTTLLAHLFAQEADFAPAPEKQRRALSTLLDTPSLGQILVARHGEGCVGMVSLLFTVSTAEGGPAAWLEDLVVLPEHRGAGLGSRLLDAALDFSRARGITRITLLTDRTNTRAQAFYARHGFTASAMIPLRCPL